MQRTRKHFSRMRTATLPSDPGLMSGGGGWVCIPTPWYTHPVPLSFPWYTHPSLPLVHPQEGTLDQAYPRSRRDMGPGTLTSWKGHGTRHATSSPPPPPPHHSLDITFPQLLLRAVTNVGPGSILAKLEFHSPERHFVQIASKWCW